MFKKIIALITSFFIVEQVASANETTNSKLNTKIKIVKKNQTDPIIFNVQI